MAASRTKSFWPRPGRASGPLLSLDSDIAREFESRMRANEVVGMVERKWLNVGKAEGVWVGKGLKLRRSENYSVFEWKRNCAPDADANLNLERCGRDYTPTTHAAKRCSPSFGKDIAKEASYLVDLHPILTEMPIYTHAMRTTSSMSSLTMTRG
jgi:hypothetical protein